MPVGEYWQYWKYVNSSWPEIVDSPIGLFIAHEIVYLGIFIPYLIADFIPSFRKYKIQKNEVNNYRKIVHCFMATLFSHIFIQFPLMVFGHPLFDRLGLQKDLDWIPSWSTIFWQCTLCLILEDFYHYWAHRFLHWKAIYKYVHKVHHYHTAPFGIAAEYAHPVETVFLGFGTMLGPIVLMVMSTFHLMTLYTWLSLRLIQTVEVHSGYSFPFWPTKIIPFWGGAKFHDLHHMTFSSNYASTFTLWDRVFGTWAGPRIP